jgi:hypothetical protein
MTKLQTRTSENCAYNPRPHAGLGYNKTSHPIHPKRKEKSEHGVVTK